MILGTAGRNPLCPWGVYVEDKVGENVTIPSTKLGVTPNFIDYYETSGRTLPQTFIPEDPYSDKGTERQLEGDPPSSPFDDDCPEFRGLEYEDHSKIIREWRYRMLGCASDLAYLLGNTQKATCFTDVTSDSLENIAAEFRDMMLFEAKKNCAFEWTVF